MSRHRALVTIGVALLVGAVLFGLAVLVVSAAAITEGEVN